ncbi:MAG: T9SS type A sorting domain-containing protein [Flavobacteriaceae bacterium]|nr:T9SS type A sorting domain-containing protein [Flavobacteriaceae bacterium]
MKKYISLCCLFFLTFSIAQIISFEAEEGFVPGPILGQGHWTSNETPGGEYLPNQIITNEMASHGQQSLKLTYESDHPGQPTPIFGAYYHPQQPVELADGTSFSYDIFLDTLTPNSSVYIFGDVNQTEQMYHFYLMIDQSGNVVAMAVNDAGQPNWIDTQLDVVGRQWYNIRIEYQAGILHFFVDNSQVLTAMPVITSPIDEFRFTHDNFGGFAYIDNFQILSGNMNSVENQNPKYDVKIYPNPVKDFLQISLPEEFKPQKTKIRVYSAEGKILQEMNFDQRISTTHWPQGVYYLQLTDSAHEATVKLMKK